jgi:DNA-binding MarR family transcriptional regulator
LGKSNTDTPDLNNKAKITLGLLSMVQDNSATSQRSMAGNLDIALGLTNAYLKRCVKKGLIKVSQAPANRYAYYLTPKGFAEKSRLTAEFLSQSLNLFRHARAEGKELLARCENRGWTRAALLGAGDLAEIMTLSARDFAVELIAIIDADADTAEHAGLPVVKDIHCPGDVDAVILCDINTPQETYDHARSQIPEERILAPRFLHISKKSSDDNRTKGTKK